MTHRSALLPLLGSLLLLLGTAQALRFELLASGKERCIRNYVGVDTLVVVKATVSGTKGDGMIVNMHVRDALGNEYGHPRDIVGESRVTFHSHADTGFDVCFENHMASGSRRPERPLRDIELDVDIGADAKDWNAIEATEKLKPLEVKLRHLEEQAEEVVRDMDYLRTRELKLRDTNESTNDRVKWFGITTTWILIGLWVWQIMYLRAYFRSKHLI
ncbi:vesicle coat component [Claviceps africana]|uniref:Vesicle coat component n=1 Tax=Claviceps africana TaxID=83212 RepID=A0A8K0NHC5_9HYPO|nr:vesicle coat component [Claviceps africana]